MKGPYSQLRSMRTSATGLSGAFESDAAVAVDSAKHANAGARDAPIKTSRKTFVRRVKLLPFLESMV
jgi:phage anti-repressor protein